MKPIPYDAKLMNAAVLIGADGKEYIGEYLDMRIDRRTIPHGKCAYDCRHDDGGDWVSPVTIENHVLVNFAGTFVTDTPVEFPDATRPRIEVEEWEFI